jgi:hypothetical protein
VDLYYPDIALHVPTVLLPRADLAYELFAVVACDQYTWQPEYWQQVEAAVGDAPSALHLILPEVYLQAADRTERVVRIRRTMRDYVDQGILQPCAPGFVLVDRQTALAPSRHGLLAAVDLEHYDDSADAGTLVRATEGTVADRLPPRVDIRTGALLEVPHILVLIDDPQGTVIEPLLDEQLPILYDFDLMRGGGRLRAWHVGSQRLVEQVARGLRRLIGPEPLLPAAPADRTKGPLLFAVGDGNHSLAAARQIWARTRTQLGPDPSAATHPARYALVELVNVHDPGLRFGPIHRLVQQVDADDLLGAMERHFLRTGARLRRAPNAGPPGPQAGALDPAGRDGVRYLAAGRYGTVWSADAHRPLELASLQAFLDLYLAGHRQARLDYIHGDQALIELASQPRALGFLLPGVGKREFFCTVSRRGPFPRKTFSLGEADEKRFYLETRRILP